MKWLREVATFLRISCKWIFGELWCWILLHLTVIILRVCEMWIGGEKDRPNQFRALRNWWCMAIFIERTVLQRWNARILSRFSILGLQTTAKRFTSRLLQLHSNQKVRCDFYFSHSVATFASKQLCWLLCSGQVYGNPHHFVVKILVSIRPFLGYQTACHKRLQTHPFLHWQSSMLFSGKRVLRPSRPDKWSKIDFRSRGTSEWFNRQIPLASDNWFNIKHGNEPKPDWKTNILIFVIRPNGWTPEWGPFRQLPPTAWPSSIKSSATSKFIDYGTITGEIRKAHELIFLYDKRLPLTPHRKLLNPDTPYCKGMALGWLREECEMSLYLRCVRDVGNQKFLESAIPWHHLPAALVKA